MSIPKEEFASWFDWARDKFVDARSYPLINEKVHNYDLLSDAYSQITDNDATREHLGSRLASSGNEIATRFVILNYYYELARFDSDHKEEYVAHLRQQFRRDLVFFVGLRPIEECDGLKDISWEIVNACAVRDWTRGQALYRRLRLSDEIPLKTFHAAYGHFLFRVVFDDYDPKDPEDNAETLSQWSVAIVDRSPDSYIEDLTFEISTFGLGLKKSFGPRAGRSDEFLRDAKNELEKARDILQSQFRPGLRSALARCYMARGEYRQAASEYKTLSDVIVDELAWTPLRVLDLRSTIWDRIATALELAQDDSGLRRFLDQWISVEPNELGPREHLAKLEAKCGNYEAAFGHLSAEYSMNPAHDQDWKATLLVELGTRAGSEQRLAHLVRTSIESNPEIRVMMDNLVMNYWPTFRLLIPEARDSFRIATRLLFDSTIGEFASTHAAMAAGKSVESELRAKVFEPFAASKRKEALTISPAVRADPLLAFIDRGTASPLTMGAMVRYLLSVVNPRENVERLLRDWLKANRPNLYGVLTSGKLRANVDVGELRNRATHASISQEETLKLYGASRNWLDALTQDK